MSRVKQSLISAISVSIGSQLYINVFFDDFIIALAVIIFGICLYIFQDLNPIKLSILIGICSPCFRCMVLWVRSGNGIEAANAALPDMIFYFCYGIIFYLIYSRSKKKEYGVFWVALALSDALSNMAELAFMNGIDYLNTTVLLTLFIIASVRASLSISVCIAIDVYKSLLTKEEHEMRYKKLMVMASVFDSEVYFMKKGIVEIEDVMKKAYTLYKRSEAEELPRDIHAAALDIAKDVHEIKKGYMRIIKGLQDNFLTNMQISSLNIKDFLSILETDIAELIRHKNKEINFTIKLESNFIIEEHYLLMSVLRNLIINGVDAIKIEEKGKIELFVGQSGENGEKNYLFRVSDDGVGIAEEDISVIFEPGYSTKFSADTGDISRGIGLTIVKDLVEERFRGSIRVDSERNRGTVFQLTIPAVCFKEG